MSQQLRAAACALRDFLRGFVGIPARGAPARQHGRDDGSKRPFCC
jgi:hypothetical protein